MFWPCSSRLLSCAIGIFFLFCKNTEMKFLEVITTANKLNDYMLSKIGTGTREHVTTENSDRRQLVLSQCQTGADT